MIYNVHHLKLIYENKLLRHDFILKRGHGLAHPSANAPQHLVHPVDRPGIDNRLSLFAMSIIVINGMYIVYIKLQCTILTDVLAVA